MAKATSPLGWHLDCIPGFSDYESVLCHGHERNGAVLLFDDWLLAHCVGHQKLTKEGILNVPCVHALDYTSILVKVV